MTRRPAPLGDADLARLLQHVPAPPPPRADLADRVVAAAVAAGNAGSSRARRRRGGRPLWWAIAVIGVAGAVTAAAANGGRFELAKVLEWPQAVVRAAGFAPRHAHGPVVVHARPTPPVVRVAAAPLVQPAQPLAPLAFAPQAHAPIPAQRFAPRLFVAPERAPRPVQGPGAAHALLDHRRPDVHPMREARHEFRPEVALRDVDRLPARPEAATPAERRPERAEIADAPRADLDRAKDEAFRFHDADEFARRAEAERRDWRAEPAEQRPWAAARSDQHHPWAGGDPGQHRWQKAQAWRQRADNRPAHPFRPHPPRGRRL